LPLTLENSLRGRKCVRYSRQTKLNNQEISTSSFIQY